jgi:hypothetical protein
MLVAMIVGFARDVAADIARDHAHAEVVVAPGGRPDRHGDRLAAIEIGDGLGFGRRSGKPEHRD